MTVESTAFVFLSCRTLLTGTRLLLHSLRKLLQANSFQRSIVDDRMHSRSLHWGNTRTLECPCDHVWGRVDDQLRPHTLAKSSRVAVVLAVEEICLPDAKDVARVSVDDSINRMDVRNQHVRATNEHELNNGARWAISPAVDVTSWHVVANGDRVPDPIATRDDTACHYASQQNDQHGCHDRIMMRHFRVSRGVLSRSLDLNCIFVALDLLDLVDLLN